VARTETMAFNFFRMIKIGTFSHSHLLHRFPVQVTFCTPWRNVVDVSKVNGQAAHGDSFTWMAGRPAW
jgi:hypothetical protein